MIDVIGRCIKDQIHTPEWQNRIKAAIPSYGKKLNENPELLEQIRQHTEKVLKL